MWLTKTAYIIFACLCAWSVGNNDWGYAVLYAFLAIAMLVESGRAAAE